MNRKIWIVLLSGGLFMFCNAETPSPKGNLTYESRKDIPAEYKWKLSDIYSSDEAWEKDYNSVEEMIERLKDFDGKVGQNAEAMFDFVNLYMEVGKKVDKLYGYAHMMSDQDISQTKYQDMVSKMQNVFVKFGENTAFFQPAVMEIGESKIGEFMEENADLKKYAHFFDDILRLKKHTLNKSEERLMALAGPVSSSPSRVFSMMNNVDFVFPKMKDENGKEIQITHGIYGKYMQSADRRLRKDVYLGIHSTYKEFRNTLAANYSGIVKAHIFNARARNYKSTREAALTPNAIPESIYDNLIKSVNANLAPLHRYVSLRKKILKLQDGVHDYDLRAPMFVSEDVNYPWDEAVELVVKGLQPMGKDYVTELEKGLKGGWVDVYENKGKRSGAYSSNAYGVHPYVLMNYNGSLGDVFTLAHEMGHSMHTFYSMKEQPYVYHDYPIFLAEIASTANEALLMDYMIKHAKTKKEKLNLLDNLLTNYARTYYRQTIFAEFEYRSHKMAEENKPLNADALENLFGEIYAKYQGPDFVLDEATKYMWSRIPHFYYNYYVFQYSTSFAASQAIVKRILEKGEPARKDFFKMLSGGSHEYPVELLKEAGVDMTTSKPFEDTAARMNKYLDMLEELLNEQ
jgi:oligoendopeptidase F